MSKENFDDLHYPENIKEILYVNVEEKMIDHIRGAEERRLSFVDDMETEHIDIY